MLSSPGEMPARKPSLFGAMFTGIRIQALIADQQAHYRFAADDVRLHNFVDIGRLHVSIPHRLRINHQVRPMLALVQASGLIGAHPPFKPEFSKLLLEQPLQFGLAGRIATSPRMPWW